MNYEDFQYDYEPSIRNNMNNKWLTFAIDVNSVYRVQATYLKLIPKIK